MWDYLRFYLGEFFRARRHKLWVLFLALLALGAFFLIPTTVSRLPEDPISLKTPPPEALVAMGNGEGGEYGLVIWWRCSACKNLLEKISQPLLQGSLATRIYLYTLDLSAEDRRTTALFRCALEEMEWPPGRILHAFAVQGARPENLEGMAGRPCYQKGMELSQAYSAYFKGAVPSLWTPMLIRDGTVLPPKEGTYEEFVARALGR